MHLQVQSVAGNFLEDVKNFYLHCSNRVFHLPCFCLGKSNVFGDPHKNVNPVRFDSDWHLDLLVLAKMGGSHDGALADKLDLIDKLRVYTVLRN